MVKDGQNQILIFDVCVWYKIIVRSKKVKDKNTIDNNGGVLYVWTYAI